MSRTMWYGGVRITADRGGGGGGGLLVGLAALAVMVLALAAVIGAVREAAGSATAALEVARPWLAPTAVIAGVALVVALASRRVLERRRLRGFRAHGRAVVLDRAERAATRNLKAAEPAEPVDVAAEPAEPAELPAPPPVRATCYRVDEPTAERAGVRR